MSTIPEIFFSYAWGDEPGQAGSREKIINDLYESLLKDNYRVIRDKNNLEYKGFISDFMARIGKGSCVVVAISKKYVRSYYCMFELYEIARNSNFDKLQFRQKVLPIVVEFVDFTDTAVIDEHFAFWENEYKKWDDLVKKRAGQLSVEQMQRFDRVKMIHQYFGKLTEWIVDMNTLSPQVLSADNFNEIKNAIIEKGSKPRRDGFWLGLIKKPLTWISTATMILLIIFWPGKIKTSLSDGPPVISQSAYIVAGDGGEQLLIVKDRNTQKFGYAHLKDTSQFISCKYDQANPFYKNMALVKESGKYHWIKRDSTDAFSGRYSYAENFQGAVAKVFDGKDTFYINSKGGPEKGPVVHINPNTIKPSTDTPIPQEAQKPIECQAICVTKGISGVRVSFTDKNNNKYEKVSDGTEMVFKIPCNLYGKTVTVIFQKNDKSDYRNFVLKEFEIPDKFKDN